ncbi:MAG: hypothetical protein EAZ85_04495 [Bacteroidetes bacterium]|nr:MAG: hypothetical protein EAZ85_04495 [Bacteroidota bacterium]TAG88677.1 MAG: hypothetical protein EAZ20_08090 [Bacteroidota bacterium]
MKKLHLFLLIIFFFQNITFAQSIDTVYTQKYLERSTSFAWTTFGGDILMLGGGSSSFVNNGTSQNINFNQTFIPRLTIGGVHFWGHTDFYVTFPLSFFSYQSTPKEFKELEYRQGIETGIKIYPLPLKSGRISPYIGTSFRLLNFKQQLEGTSYKYGGSEWQKMIFPLQIGLSYTSKKYIWNVGLNYQALQKIENYISPNQVAEVKFSPISFQIGLTRYIDTDKNMRSQKNIAQENLKHHILDKEKHLSSWYWGLGPSAGLQISKSPYLKTNFPHLYDNFIGGFMPDITFGRFLNKPDMNIGLSYRTLGSTLKAFDDKISIRRHSFMIEIYKNLFNWLGFVPFAGITGSIENLNVKVNDLTFNQTKPAIGFIFGWDIRVTKTGTNLLRTNLRWIPNLNLEIDNKKMMFDNLEFNFIQWVQFIGRKKTYKKYQSN